MPRFMITRTLPPLTPEQLEAVRAESTRVCNSLGITWVRSHLTADGRHSFCEYDAPDEEAVREHSRQSGIPFDLIQPVGMELGPSWAR
jgi:hypothetical protein